jgi:hypothetical protein
MVAVFFPCVVTGRLPTCVNGSYVTTLVILLAEPSRFCRDFQRPCGLSQELEP